MCETRAPRARRRALVADDDPVTRMVIAAALQEMDLTVEEAEDGAAALEAARRAMPDLFILDVQMPHLDGFETCAAIREMPGGEDVPILIVTGRDDLPCIERAFEVGATDFVTKPINTALLQHRLRFQMRASDAFREVSDTLAELRASQRRLDKSQELARLGDWEWNLETDRLILSAQATEIMGCGADPPSSPLDFLADCVHPRRSRRPPGSPSRKSARPPGTSSSSTGFPTGNASSTTSWRRTSRSRARGVTVAGTVQDITDRKRAEEQIRQLAFYDSLTGLPNRRLLEDHLDKALAWAKQSGNAASVSCSSTWTASSASTTRWGTWRATRSSGRWPSACSPRCASATPWARAPRAYVAQTSVSRFGGDEFAVVLSGLRDGQDAGRVAQRLLGNLRRPFTVQQQQVTLAASIGIAICPTDGTDSASLFRKADMAMHHAKERGRDNHQFFSASMNEAALRAMEIEKSLAEALEQNRMLLHYQPLVRADSGEIVGAEALVRMQEPGGELVPPGEFIPIAEESGLIIPLGAWVLRAACSQLARWHAEGWESGRISVNISAHQLRQRSFLHLVRGALNQAGVDPRFLEIEITESVLLEERGVDALQELRQMGISIAIDDFGTGFSSLSYLSRTPRGRAQDRPQLRQRHREGRGADRRGHHRHGPRARLLGRGRGRRDRAGARRSCESTDATFCRASTAAVRFPPRTFRWKGRSG